DEWRATELDLALHGAVLLHLGPLSITPGLRVGPSGIDVSRRTPRVGESPEIGDSRLSWVVLPRLQAELSLLSFLRLEAGAALVEAPPDPEDLSAVFGTPALGG